MQNFRFIGAMVTEFRFFKRRTICENHLYFTPRVIFSSVFGMLLHVLHLDALKRQKPKVNSYVLL